MQLNPSEISELIKSRIQGLGAGAELRNQGTVISVTDGICRIHGLSDAMQGEMLEFPGNTFGLALNLERDSVGAVILGAYEHISEGDTVKCTGRILEVPIGPELRGRVVNALGQPIDGKGPINAARQAVMVKVDKAITQFDPTFTNQDPDFGAVYEAMLRVSDAGYGNTGNAVLDYGDFNHEISLTTTLCKPILQAAQDAGQTPAP